jgi:hypothetical protein
VSASKKVVSLCAQKITNETREFQSLPVDRDWLIPAAMIGPVLRTQFMNITNSLERRGNFFSGRSAGSPILQAETPYGSGELCAPAIGAKHHETNV